MHHNGGSNEVASLNSSSESLNADEFTWMHNKEIQQKLLDAEEAALAKELLRTHIRASVRHSQRQKSSLNFNNSLATSGLIVGESSSNGKNNTNASNANIQRSVQAGPVVGWCADPDIVYRKSENDEATKQKGNTFNGIKDGQNPRDWKNKFTAQDFVFRHYTDPRCYIEQYRQEHACSDNTVSCSGLRNEIWDSKKHFPVYQPSPITLFSHLKPFLQNTFLPPASRENSNVQLIDKQLQLQQKTPPVLDPKKGDQHKQAPVTDLRNVQALDSASSSSDISKVTKVLDLRTHLQRTGSVKELVFGSAESDMAFQKTNASALKYQGQNKMITTKIVRIPRPGSPLEPPNVRSHFIGQKLGLSPAGMTGLSRLDTFPSSSPNGHDRQSTGVQAIDNCAGNQLEPSGHSKWTPKPRAVCPAVTPLTHNKEVLTLNKEVRTQIKPESVSAKVDRSSNGATVLGGNDENNFLHKADNYNVVAGSVRQDVGRSHMDKVSNKMEVHKLTCLDQKLSRDVKSPLAVVGFDCCKPKKIIYDRWAESRKEANLLLSQNQRIRQAIGKSKIKSKFDTILKMSSNHPRRRRVLDLNSVQIGDFFADVAIQNERNTNENNCELLPSNVSLDPCLDSSSASVSASSNSSMLGNSDGSLPRHKLNTASFCWTDKCDTSSYHHYNGDRLTGDDNQHNYASSSLWLLPVGCSLKYPHDPTSRNILGCPQLS